MGVLATQPVGMYTRGIASRGDSQAAGSPKFAGLMRSALTAGQAKASDAWGQYVKGTSAQPSIQVADGTTMKLAALQANSKANLQSVQQQLASFLSQNGVDVGAGVSLQVDASGEVNVLSPDAQKSTIESLLESRPDIESSVVSAVQDAQILQAAANVHGTGDAAQQTFSAAFAGLSTMTAIFTLTGVSDQMAVSFVPAD